MTRYHIIEHHRTHTCPADPTPHPFDIQRTVVRVEPTGPCLAPVVVRSGATVTTVACRRRYRHDRQCANCRNQVIVIATSTEQVGHEGPPTHRQLALDLAAT